MNVQPDQKVVVNATLENAPLARLITAFAFEASAKDVIINWSDSEVTALRYNNAPLAVFETPDKHRAAKLTELAKEGACFISITSEDPDLLKGVDGAKIAANQRANGDALAEYRELMMSNTVSWTVVAAASEGWAKKSISRCSRIRTSG